jgi:trigger factor
MEIKSNKINGANAEIQAIILKEVIDANLNKIAKQLTKTANVQGFRKGKVPVSVIKKQYGERLEQDAEAEVLRDVLSKGLEALNISNEQLIGEPSISQFDKTDDKIEVTVKVAMRPEIDMGDYASLVSEFDKPAISDDEINDRIKQLAESLAEVVTVEEDRALVNGDIALIDFEGSIDGELFAGGAAKEFALTLGSGQFIPGFEDQVVGMKKGEEKIVKVTFPANYGSDKLAGKDAEFKVNVHAIQAKGEIVIDEELAKKMLPGQEDASLESLKSQVKIQIENEKLGKLFNDELKPALLETFVDKFVFDLPEFVVDQEIDMALNNKARTMSEDEIKELRESQEKLEALRETFREDAQRSVKATFIIDSLAKAENVTISEQEVMQTIYYEAMQMGQDPQKAFENYKKAGYIPAIQMSMVEDRVLSKLLTAKMKEA